MPWTLFRLCRVACSVSPALPFGTKCAVIVPVRIDRVLIRRLERRESYLNWFDPALLIAIDGPLRGQPRPAWSCTTSFNGCDSHATNCNIWFTQLSPKRGSTRRAAPNRRDSHRVRDPAEFLAIVLKNRTPYHRVVPRGFDAHYAPSSTSPSASSSLPRIRPRGTMTK